MEAGCMNLQDRAMELSKGVVNSKTQAVKVDVCEQTSKNTSETMRIGRVSDEKLTDLNEAIDELKRVICSFSAVTDRVEAEKQEITRLSKEIARQKLESGKLLYELNAAIKSFPVIASESIQSSIGVTSGQL